MEQRVGSPKNGFCGYPVGCFQVLSSARLPTMETDSIFQPTPIYRIGWAWMIATHKVLWNLSKGYFGILIDSPYMIQDLKTPESSIQIGRFLEKTLPLNCLSLIRDRGDAFPVLIHFPNAWFGPVSRVQQFSTTSMSDAVQNVALDDRRSISTKCIHS